MKHGSSSTARIGQANSNIQSYLSGAGRPSASGRNSSMQKQHVFDNFPLSQANISSSNLATTKLYQSNRQNAEGANLPPQASKAMKSSKATAPVKVPNHGASSMLSRQTTGVNRSSGLKISTSHNSSHMELVSTRPAPVSATNSMAQIPLKHASSARGSFKQPQHAAQRDSGHPGAQ